MKAWFTFILLAILGSRPESTAGDLLMSDSEEYSFKNEIILERIKSRAEQQQKTFEPLLSTDIFKTDKMNRIHPDDIYWTDQFGLSGFDNAIYSMAVYENQLVVAGFFTSVGIWGMNHIAVWNGNYWNFLGDANGEVLSLTVYDSKLIAAGNFTNIGGISVKNIAQWDGNSWAPIGSLATDGYIWSVGTWNGRLYAGGMFTMIGGTAASHIAEWDGDSWNSLGSGVNSGVFDICEYNGELIVGGTFSVAGEGMANRIARWNGASWQGVGSVGLNGAVYTLGTYQGKLIAGGDFTSADGTPTNRIASWNGSSWQPLAEGVSLSSGNAWVDNVVEYNGELVVVGHYSQAGNNQDLDSVGVAAWNGTHWRYIGLSIWSGVLWTEMLCGAVYNGQLYLGGDFQYAWSFAGSPSFRWTFNTKHIARWNGTTWSAVGAGIRDASLSVGVKAMTTHEGALYAGGSFDYTAGGWELNNLAWFDGASWGPTGGGVRPTGSVAALESIYNDSTHSQWLVVGGNYSSSQQGIAYYTSFDWWRSLPGGVPNGPINTMCKWGDPGFFAAGGSFTSIGDSAALNVALWKNGGWNHLGNGLNGTVNDLCVYKNQLYAAGNFSYSGLQSLNNIAVWVGGYESGHWSPLLNGVNGPVNALTIFGDRLIVAGQFSNAGGIPASNIAQWDGLGWLGMGTGLGSGSEYVADLIVFSGRLYACGMFDFGGLNSIAMWNGFGWSALGSGLGASYTNPPIPRADALAVVRDTMYVGGCFDLAGDKESYYVAAWTKLYYVCGDANGSGAVSILDVTYLLSYLYKDGPAPNPLSAGDANGNGMVNILDATYLLSYLYKKGPAPVCGP